MKCLQLEFPLEWEYKIIADQCAATYEDICAVARTHGCACMPEAGNLSKSGKYVTYTMCLDIASQEDLDALTQALAACPGVKYVL